MESYIQANEAQHCGIKYIIYCPGLPSEICDPNYATRHHGTEGN